MQRKKREVLARRKYALLPSSSSSSESELSRPINETEEDMVVSEASSTPQVTACAEIDVTLTDSEVETVAVGESDQSCSTLGHCRSPWSQGSSSHTSRPQEPRNRSRISTVMQPLRQNAAEVVDLTVDEDDDSRRTASSAVTETGPPAMPSQYSGTNPSASSSHTPANFTSYSSHCTSSTETSSSRSDAEDGSSKKEDDATSNAGT
ncbi:E3 Ubiquitin-Protein Ligase Arkadia [Manis pentadactyla]|nr:E3 Ubiquitin-Protein Ligase Arkadia [Manis pentadactyla]